MRQYPLAKSLLAATVVALSSNCVHAGGFSAVFSGFNEIGALNANTGAILSPGTGTLHLQIDAKAGMATYTLDYSSLTSNVTQAHIHFGKVHDAGGIFVFLCTNLGNGPAGTPACPPAGGTVTGTITAASILAVPGQNVTAGDFSTLEDIVTSDTAYANIHTMKFPAGEIRGQLRKNGKDD